MEISFSIIAPIIVKINIEAARIITGATKLVHVSLNKLYTESGFESLETRRKQHKLTVT